MEPRRIAPFTYEVPKGWVTGMRVPGRIFATDDLFAKAMEDKAADQVANVATLPGIVRASFAMPDIHWGYGFPIGGVAATDPNAGGVVSPGGVGFDIGCGVRLLRSDVALKDAAPRMRELITALGRAVPRGVGGKGLWELDPAAMEAVLRDGARHAIAAGYGTDEDLETIEDHGALETADPGEVPHRAKERGAPQLGSLGAGNHFLEVQVVDEVIDENAARAMGLWEQQVCIMIHSGSRGVGHQTCQDYVRTIDELMGKLGIDVPDRQLACAPYEHPATRSYVKAMDAAANFARANRQLLTHAARRAFAQTLRGGGDGLGIVYDVSHNLAKLEDHEVDGTRRTLCVHRKGATRALGPGHPELPARYRGIGQPVIIPGSMGTASYVLTGTERSAELAFSSTCHGAGRAMSRTKARKQMHGGQLKKELEDRGILVAAGQTKALAEEAPFAYKDVSEVVAACEGAGLSKVVARLRPLGVVKG